MTIEIVGNLVADQPGHIKCLATNGRPAPLMSLQITDPMPEFLNNSLTQTPGTNQSLLFFQSIHIHSRPENLERSRQKNS